MSKRKVNIAVISDVHLGSIGANAESLNIYLRSIHPEILIINGDFIDGWNFKKRYFPKSHFEVIRRILKMMNRGTKIYYITGNHDEFMRQYAGYSLGGFEILNQLELEYHEKRMWFFHGDVFDASIQGRMKYLAKLGGKAYDFLIWYNRITNDFLELLGKERMSFSKAVKNSVKAAVKWIADFEEVAAELAIEKGFDFIGCGHIHSPQIRKISNENGSVTYLNSGDWIENNSSLELENGEWKIFRFNELINTNLELEDMENEVYVEQNMAQLISQITQIKTSKA